jgi:hypothetical protein
MDTFPYQAILISEPDNAYARAFMTVGKEYTVSGPAGSCLIVSTDGGSDTMVWAGRLEAVKVELPI